MDSTLTYTNDDAFTVKGRLALPYQYFAGRIGSKFLISLRDEKKILGIKCPKCNKVFVPPRSVCEQHITEKCTEWVTLSGVGSVTGFTVVRYKEPYQPCEPPYILVLIKLDGADSSFAHIVKSISLDKMKIGLRVKPVFREKSTSTIMDIDHFEEE